MPRIAGKVIKTKNEGGELKAILKFNGKLPPEGALVTVKYGSSRSNQQNKFYWAYLTFLYETCGLKSEYLTVEDLHETFKATFLSKKTIGKNGFELIKVKSTTDLDKQSFSEYIDKIDKAMSEYHNISSAEFFQDYEDFYRPGE